MRVSTPRHTYLTIAHLGDGIIDDGKRDDGRMAGVDNTGLLRAKASLTNTSSPSRTVSHHSSAVSSYLSS